MYVGVICVLFTIVYIVFIIGFDIRRCFKKLSERKNEMLLKLIKRNFMLLLFFGSNEVYKFIICLMI